MGKRVPIHDHTDINSGGKLVASAATTSSSGGASSTPSSGFGSPVAVGTALSDGTDVTAARAGHVHTNAYLGTVLVYGTASSAQVLTAQGAGSATWAASAGGGGSVTVYDESAVQGTVTIFDFVGAGVSAGVAGGTATITISGGTTTASIVTLDEGSVIGTASVINFTGVGGTASYSGGTTTFDVPGLIVFDEGTLAGTVTKLNIVGSSGTIAVSGGTATLTLSGGGGLTHTYIGYNTAGGSWESMTSRRVYTTQVTVGTAGVLSSISAYIQAAGNADSVGGAIKAMLYDDSSGTPNNLIFTTPPAADWVLMDDTTGAGGASTPRWFHQAVGAYLGTGTYWIAVMTVDTSDTIQLAYDGSGSDLYYTSGGNWVTDWGFYTGTATTNKYSIRGSLIT